MSKIRPKPPEDAQRSLALTAHAQIELEAAGDGADATPRIPRFRMVAYTGVPMRIAAWRYPVIVDLAGLHIPSQARPIRFSHDPGAGIGHTDSIRIESGQLVATGLVSRDTAIAREIVASAKNGFPWQASIGSSVEEFEFVKDGQNVLVNGQSYRGPLNVVRKATLGEISFVDLGADGATTASIAAQQRQESTDMIVANDNSTNPTQVAATAEASTTATVQTAAPVTATADDPVTQMRTQAAAESARIAAVRKLCAKHPDVEATAIAEGWDVNRTELEVLRASRPAVPHMITGASIASAMNGGATSQVLEAACMLTAGLGNLDKVFDEQTLDAASKRFRGGIGLQELLLEAAWANGYSGRNFRDNRSVLRFAFGHDIAASGQSTIDISGILSNVANKFLLEGFFSVERTWRNITAVRNVSDFKTVTSYRLIGKDQYEKVLPGGELKHGTLGEQSYSNKADTYGLLLSIDRRDVINDDLGAITTVPRKLGRGSGLKINDVFWAEFLANSNFFKTANKNYLEGADTALGIDGLTKAEVAFLDQVDPDGKPIGVMPAIVLVPTALSAIGTQLYKSLELRETTSNVKYPIANPHQGKFRVEVSRYLANALYTGNSAKAWYLLADPNDLPVIEVAFLNGQESPTIETAEADANVLGIFMRGYHDFGVALQEPRGGVKAKGEA
jgi:lipoprotein-anchoring transpeptidase ErfK/SrfK